MLKLGSPFWSYYALLALMEAGEIDATLEYMRLCWGLMLEHGATSCWEMWDRHTSLCHGWSGAPCMVLPAYVLGVRPLDPGFETFCVEPRFGDLAWARGKVPTPLGTIGVNWRRRGDRVEAAIDVPPGARARVRADLPGQRGWQIDGKRRLTLGPGSHRVTFSR